MSKKIKVLAYTPDGAGVSYHRTEMPHIKLSELYSDEFDVEINKNVNWNDLNYLSKFQIIHFHRTLVDFSLMEEYTNKLKSMGIKLVVDIDDFWELDKTHPSYHLIKEEKLAEKIISVLKMCDYVTTTTPFFADIIKNNNINKNVVVLPNAIDLTQPQYIPNKVESEFTRIIYLAGSSHGNDMKLLDGMVNILRSNVELNNKFQFNLAGWDIRGTMTEINPRTKEKNVRPIKPEESIYFYYEKILTDNHKLINDKKYLDYLLTFNKEQYPNEENQPYRRFWTKPVNSYAKSYNNADISLAPLQDNLFNNAKSQLKLIEAFPFKLAVVASDVVPYKIDGVNDKNCLLIPNTKNSDREYAKAIKKLIQNPNMRIDLGEKLYEDLKPKYDLDVITKIRAEFYKSII
jgi:glycosyltransferase involved in cell wall biosynthesis